MTQQQELEAEFPRERVQSISKSGHSLSYVPVAEVIQRLNDVLGTGGWSWNCTRVWRDETDPDWMLATGDLSATVDGETSSRSGTGGVKVKKTNAGAIVDLGDEAKGAESDALKKAAQRFGVALYLGRKAEAIAYEAPVPVRDPEAEGWESQQRWQEYTRDLKNRIAQAPVNVQTEMREYRERLGYSWPPSYVEWTVLDRHFYDLMATATVEPLEAPATPEAGLPRDEIREAETAIQRGFPGAEDVTPAAPDELEALSRYLARFKNDGDQSGTRAFNKYAKEKRYPDDRRTMTSAQVSEALDFIENL